MLASAVKAFARRGYSGTALTHILTATGLSKPTLYYHFKSKAGLFRAILDFAYDESFRLMQGARAAGNCEQRLIAVAAGLFEFAERNHDLTRLVFATVFAAPEEIPPGSIDPAKRRRNFDFVLAMVRDGQKAGELDSQHSPAELTHGILGAISHQIRAHLLHPESPLDRRKAKRLVALFINGAVKREQERE